MQENNNHGTTRRTYLKQAGVSAATITALAGCMGDDGNGDGGNGDGGNGNGGNGDGGNDGTTAPGDEDNDSGNLQTVSQAVVPSNMGAPYAMDKWYDEIGVLGEDIGYPLHEDGIQARWEEHGYDLQFQTTWDDATLFASRQIQLAHTAPIGAIQMGVEQDTVINIFGISLANQHGWMVQTDGPYDPDNTGSVQASIDKIVEDDALVSHTGWSAGSLKYEQIIFENKYGYSMRQEDNDFNIQTSDYAAIPDLVANGEIAAGVTLPLAGAGYQQLAAEESAKMLFWDYNIFLEEDWGIPILQTPSAHQDFFDENPEAIRLMLEDWNKGQQEYIENAEAIASDERGWDMIGAETEEGAQWLTDMFVTADGDIEERTLLYPVALDDDRIEEMERSTELAAELGTIPSDWENYVNFVHKDEILTESTPEPLDA